MGLSHFRLDNANNSLVNGAQTDTDPINRDMGCCIPYSTYAIINDKMDNHISLTVQPMDENDCDSFNYVTRDNSKTARCSSPFTMLFDEVGVNQSPSNPNCAKEFSDNKVSQIATNKEDCRITKNSIKKGKGFTTLNTKEPWKEAQNRMALTIALSDPQPKPLCDQSSVLGRVLRFILFEIKLTLLSRAI
ncbi:MAG: hypothetical protein GY821_06795 [Gammaproteobacteria bacterium]|nr:hypothetical protein [Gammaproteobacteria bacterium]